VRIRRQGQDAARGHDLVAADDDGAVVERRIGREQRLDERRVHACVEARAGLHEVSQPLVPLDHDETAVAVRGQALGRAHDLAQHAVLADAQERAEERRTPELRERVPQLRLEQDDERDEPDGAQVGGDVVHRDEAEEARRRGHDHEHEEADEHLRRARALDAHEQAVEQHRHEQDVEDVEEPELVNGSHGGPRARGDGSLRAQTS